MRRKLTNGLVVASMRPEHADQLERLQRLVFPTLADAERFRREHYLQHLELFPAGQFVVLDENRVVGMTSSIRYDLDGDSAAHTFADVIQGGWLTSHNPQGKWLYGADMGTHPEYRRRGVARALYAARHETVARLGLAGQVTAGMVAGYGAVRERVTPEEYFGQLVRGERCDPTITAQQRIGFVPRALLANYVQDPVCAGYAVLMTLAAEQEVRWE